MKQVYLFLIALFMAATPALANNVQITNVSIINGGPGQIQVQFDLSWSNSWRTNVGPNNYDGVWVFFKYKTASGNWTHMTLTGNNNVIPSGFDVYQTNDFLKTGALIYRENTNMGTGPVTISGIKLGAISTLPYDIDLKSFALEMVYVPPPTTRPFFGDGNGTTESGSAFHYTDNTATTGSVVPMLTDANGFDDAELDTDGIYVYSNDTIQKTNPLGTLDPFPTMKAIWCMKYEINQAGYRDFLNTLTYDQQATRTAVAPSSAAATKVLASVSNFRNAIEIVTSGVASSTPAKYGCDLDGDNIFDENTDGEWVACGWLTWPDVAAYLDWSGLAPMCELQFERMNRGHTSAGPNAAVYGEYAWGTNTVYSAAPYALTSSGAAGEAASNSSTTLGNGVYSSNSPGGPIRSGMFATANSKRIKAGASFFGIMEMSGNLNEYCITMGNAAGRSVRFIPNGNGNISADGNAQLSVGGAGFWPGMEGNASTSVVNTCSGTCEVTSSGGMMLRGGSFADISSYMSISDRAGGGFTPTARSANRGGRGVLYIR
jgi:hypothetical protein